MNLNAISIIYRCSTVQDRLLNEMKTLGYGPMKEYWFPDPSILLLRAKNTITPHARLPSCMINVKKTQIDFFVFNIRKHEIMKIGQDNENYMALIIWQCTHKSRITRGMIAYGMKLKHYWHSTFLLLCILFDNICIIKNILTSSRFPLEI